MIIKQTHYPQLEIDNSEKDHVQIWNNEKDVQVIHIEREKIDELIKMLEACKHYNSL